MKRGFTPIRNGIQEHLEHGRLGSFDLGIYVRIHLDADYRSGIWWGSAQKLIALAPFDGSLRHVQKSLRRLEAIGFIRRFLIRGKHGNYPVLINKYEIRDGALKGKRLNAWRATDWKHAAYETVTDEWTEKATERGTDEGIDRTPYKKNKESRGKSKQFKPSREPPTKTNDSEKKFRLQAAGQLAELLAQRILENNEKSELRDDGTRERRIKAWTVDIEQMIRIDGWSVEEIRDVIEFSQRDPFWRANILSAAKLRKQRDQLRLRMQEQQRTQQGAMNRAEQRTARNLEALGLT